MTSNRHPPHRLLADHQSQWQSIDDLLEAGEYQTGFRQSIERLAIASPYAVKQMLAEPELIERLAGLEDFELDGTLAGLVTRDRIDEALLKRELRRYRHRKLVEIIYLDLIAGHPLQATLERLSDLAEQLIGVALAGCERHLSATHGQPLKANGEAMQLNLIAMGKLGGRELNFSSDVDLICSYEHDGELEGFGKLSYQEYFTRVVKLLGRVLGESTADGFVYRVDLRLRPWGDSGPIVLTHSALEHYYQLHGREWEQYAMVKARVITGNSASRLHLETLLKPFVYRRYHDYRVFEGLAQLKKKIDSQSRSQGMKVNIKIGPGGIREIEFFVQAFQILKGGRIRDLQQPSIFAAFEILAKQELVDTDTLGGLHDAYCFLRRLENCLQMYEDRQTHDLPEDPARQARIAYALRLDDWDSLLQRLGSHRELVNNVFRELFREKTEGATQAVIDEGFDADTEEDREWSFVTESGIEGSDEINRQLNRFLRSKAWNFMSARARQRFDRLLPELLLAIGESADAPLLFERFLRLFSSIAGRSVYFELLFQNRALLERLASLFAQSAWIADEVSAYPMLLENLIQPAGRQLFDRSELAQRLQRQIDNVAGDVELELDSLRLFKREHTLVIAGAELAGEIDALDASRYLSELAEVILEAVLELASANLQTRHGVPECNIGGVRREAGFAIIGYGKLGGYEMHYQSDLDIIFLHDSDGEQQYTNGENCIENAVYFARLAQKVISMTSVLTPSGKLYEIDSRLRPEGSSGLLVSSVKAYRRYQLEKAWTWEHQALVRARLVAGERRLGEAFEAIRIQALCLPRDVDELRREIVEMRARIYQAKRPPEGERRDLKHSHGGMVDIEFLVQYWVLSQANNIGSDSLYSDNINLLNELFRLNLITGSQSQLAGIYTDYHRLLHESVLRDQSSEVDAGIIEERLQQVINCWNECFGVEN